VCGGQGHTCVCMWRPLCNVERVENEDVMVVLGEGDHISLAGDLQAATAGHLQTDGRGSLIDGWTLDSGVVSDPHMFYADPDPG